jgi:uncharacterized membrane protein YqjE
VETEIMSATNRVGPIEGLRELAANLAGSVRDRIALLSLEVEEERDRLLLAFAWISAAMIAGSLALLLASITVVYLFWDTARLAVLIGLTVLYSGVAVAVIVGLRRHLARQPRPFAASLAELEADQTCLREEP